MIRNHEIEDVLKVSRVIAFCALSNYGSLDYARRIFALIKSPNIYIWNTIIRGYVQSSNPSEAFALYKKLLSKGLIPNNYTFPFLLKACTQLVYLNIGSSIHASTIKYGFEDSDAFIQTALVHLYASCGFIDLARKMFDRCDERDVTSWNALMKGYVHSGRHREAISLFQTMLRRASWVKPDEVTMLAVLTACGHSGALDRGSWVHRYMEANKLKRTIRLETALVDMYAKCGSIETARRLFDATVERDGHLWSVMIGGLAMHGMAKEALSLFSEMQRVGGVVPDSVTFTSVLSACSHAGLVQVGLHHLEIMKDYGIESTIEHYGCVVDLFGRAGLLQEAMEFVKKMPVKPDVALWGSVLLACNAHGNVKIGEVAAKEMLGLDPLNGGAHVFLSNIYASTRSWDEVIRVRNQMKDHGITKPPGCSLIEVDGFVHEFLVGDRSHPEAESIYKMLDEIDKLLKREVYGPTSKGTFFDVDEEESEHNSD
ncbi:pentatricopeptide repeat-containing protein At4g21065-like [Amborella trichopoda]|uniref:pentatricopeptide repeat-containing protein At4g21065-like n=1 Tax=Amborella trichopoda TaxID=13333 RepID=UPI0005D2ED6F|nr:pentatricopeptide repeat-containing protein At4g21065-like [Amborella trichopoda]|eukprot:XP_011624582.1 pentatricopeptide repeat-containing protein At4g21065-like [Amborella trichopoda]